MIWFDDEEYANYDDSEPTEADIFKSGEWPFGASGKADDVPVPEGPVCAQISNILGHSDDNNKAGEYSFGGEATTLTVAPGLFVQDVGSIALPLCKEQADKLIIKCDKSPFGRKLDTLMDENVRKSWQLQPDQVEIKNPLWTTGMDQLGDTIASRLGYKGVPMQCLLYKMLVYGEGGHFVKHQDTEKEDGMVATLVVQLPSEHEGGDLVVYRGGKEVQRHDFGKKNGTASYLPHFAVHYADAEHSLEKVTKGYRLVLVYSICLPANMRGLERNPDKSMSEELAGAISCMESEDKLFSLLLTHEYTEKSITGLGSGALKGVDRARMEALQEANNAVDCTKKLLFFFADLTHDAAFYDAGGEWEEDKHKESITWFSMSGKKLATASKTSFFLNFLNPDQETLADLWDERGESTFEGYLGNEGATRNTSYSRYAIVAWPVANGVENTLKFINADAAIEALKAQKPVAPDALRKFINAVGDKVDGPEASTYQPLLTAPKKSSISDEFSQTLCEFLIECGDTSLVNLFFSKICSSAGDCSTLMPTIIKLARTFDWNEIGQELLSALKKNNKSTGFGAFSDAGVSTMLQVVQGVNEGPAKQASIKAAVQVALNVRNETLCSSRVIGSLWSWTILHGDKSDVENLANIFKSMDAEKLRPVTDMFLRDLRDIDALNEHFAVLKSIAGVRIKWLKTQTGPQEKPFTWEMPNAEFSDNARIQSFLHGPELVMKTTGVRIFSGLPDARKFATRTPQVNASFKMEPAGRGKDAYVTITKTREWFTKQQGKSGQYKAELKRLTDRFGDVSADDGPAQKRARLEVAD